MNARRKIWILAVLAALILTLVLRATAFQVNNVRLREETTGEIHSITLPLRKLSVRPGKFQISSSLDVGTLTPRAFWLRVDDCLLSLKINGTEVDMPTLTNEDRCSWTHGFSVDGSKYFVSGSNQIDLLIQDQGGYFGASLTSPPSLIRTFLKFLNLVAWCGALFGIWRELNSSKWVRSLLIKTFRFSRRRATLFGVLSLVLSFFTYFRGYADPQKPFWDENYYIPSAQRYLHRTFFMQSHPPLGKLLIALGEKILGPDEVDNQFVGIDHATAFPPSITFSGYRFFPALMGWLTAPLFYLCFLIILGSPLWAFLFSFLYIFDNALIVHSRGAMLDSPLHFFCLLVVLQGVWLLREKGLSGHVKWAVGLGSALGLVLATKLTGVVVGLVLAGVLYKIWQAFGFRRCLRFAIVSGLACTAVLAVVWQIHFSLGIHIDPRLPKAGFYTASPAYRKIVTDRLVNSPLSFPVQIIDHYNFMKADQEGVGELNTCSPLENGSAMWTWPLGGRAISYRWDNVAQDSYQYLYLQSNPVVWMGGLAGIFLTLVLVVGYQIFSLKRPFPSMFPMAVISFVYLTYMACLATLPRVLYLYHYFLPLLMSFILLAYVFKGLNRWGSKRLYFSTKTLLLLLVSVMTVASFWYYRPLTYYIPIANDDFRARNLLSVWGLRCANCE